MLQRHALAAFLRPIYQVYSIYLRSHTEFSHLFNRNFPVNQLWYNLHHYLIQHGFSEATVDRFIRETEERNELVPSRNMTYSSRPQLKMEDYDPEIRQFSERPPPVEQAIFDHIATDERQRLTALGMASHPRLGPLASPLAKLLSMNADMRSLVLGDYNESARLQRAAGYSTHNTP
jgi:hypothetical protein